MKERDIPEVTRLIEKRDHMNKILTDIDASDTFFLSYTTGQVPNHQNNEAIRLMKSNSHPLFYEMKSMAHKYWMEQYKRVVSRLKELGLE